MSSEAGAGDTKAGYGNDMPPDSGRKFTRRQWLGLFLGFSAGIYLSTYRDPVMFGIKHLLGLTKTHDFSNPYLEERILRNSENLEGLMNSGMAAYSQHLDRKSSEEYTPEDVREGVQQAEDVAALGSVFYGALVSDMKEVVKEWKKYLGPWENRKLQKVGDRMRESEAPLDLGFYTFSSPDTHAFDHAFDSDLTFGSCVIDSDVLDDKGLGYCDDANIEIIYRFVNDIVVIEKRNPSLDMTVEPQGTEIKVPSDLIADLAILKIAPKIARFIVGRACEPPRQP